MLSPTALLWTAALPFALLIAFFLVVHGSRQGSQPSRLVVLGLITLLTLSALAYVFKAPRRLHPLVFWSGWTQAVQSTRASWAQMEAKRQQIQLFADQLQPKLDTKGKSTVVLVISDSVNRDNLGLYGYARATTPDLTSLKGQLGDNMLVLKNAWAVEASTLPALNKIFTLKAANGQDSDPAHIIAMAKAAGYKTWWISNHDDMAIEQQHAKLADVVEFENRVPGRAGDSLDSAILDCVEEALAEPTDRKFIIVHLLGAHPHYGLRYPGNKNPFLAGTDAVDIKLAQEGRSTWTRYMREEYDAAILYHDRVVSEIFKMTKADAPERQGEYRAWMYLSDHGQEVGHTKDFAGHSPNTAAGYRIPVVIWRNQDWPQKPELASSVFRSDWTSWTLADLLNLQWDGYRSSKNILSANYEWQAPLLPIPVQSYTE